MTTAVVHYNVTQRSSTLRLTFTKKVKENLERTYIVSILLIRIPALAVWGGEKFISFDVISVSTWISLCCYTTQQMKASKVNLIQGNREINL